MMIDTLYNLDQIVYLPFKIDGIRVELEGETKYKLIAGFENDSWDYDRLGDGYTIRETDLIKYEVDPEDTNRLELTPSGFSILPICPKKDKEVEE